MTDTRALLERIATFRERLAAMPKLQEPAPRQPAPRQPAPRQSDPMAPPKAAEPAAPKLTARAQRLLLQARELVQRQRQIAADAKLIHDTDPLTRYHRGTVGLTDSALRLAQQFPDDVEAQLQACGSFEFLVQVIEQRLQCLQEAIAIRASDEHRLDRLCQLLCALHGGRATTLNPLVDVANEILDESRKGKPLRFGCPVEAAAGGVVRFVATHALNTAQVIARLLPHDYEWAAKPQLPVIAALVMDLGTLGAPDPLLFKAAAFTPQEQRGMEAHARASAEIIRKLLPESGPLADIVQAHHERPDGTGYPFGLTGESVPVLARFLAVADTYAALMTARHHRPAQDSRAALTEVLLMAEQGRLDRDFAEYLLNL
jgi:HD-GYP domain-containing protein (c-di-GMP phosphodiesterase class II)